MPADARREPPSDAGHGGGRPPDGPPEGGSWAFARGLKSMFGWPQQDAAPALPPLTASGLRAQSEAGHHDGGVHRPTAPSPGARRPNVVSNAYSVPRVSGDDEGLSWPRICHGVRGARVLERVFLGSLHNRRSFSAWQL